jgi:hypothetical protein
MNRLTKTILAIGFILIAYGYLVRILQIRFFWDSKDIGWILLFIALLTYWIDLRKRRIHQGKRTTWVTVGLCFLILGLGILPIVVFKIKTSSPYDAAIKYLKVDSRIRDELGEVKGFGFFPGGSVEISIKNGVESGRATFKLTIRGDKKYKDVLIDLEKLPETVWTVTDLR